MSPSDYEMIEQGYDPPRMTHPLEEENRRLRALLKEARSQIHGDCWIREDLQRRINAALAAEPASGETTQQQPDDTLKRCTHCGFIVDTKYKAEFPK